MSKYTVPIAAAATVAGAAGLATMAVIYGNKQGRTTPEERLMYVQTQRVSHAKMGLAVTAMGVLAWLGGGSKPGSVGRGVLWGCGALAAVLAVDLVQDEMEYGFLSRKDGVSPLPIARPSGDFRFYSSTPKIGDKVFVDFYPDPQKNDSFGFHGEVRALGVEGDPEAALLSIPNAFSPDAPPMLPDLPQGARVMVKAKRQDEVVT